MRRSLHRIDTNQKGIVKALRQAGATVESLTSVGLGVPDLLVGYRGTNFLMEVKREGGSERVSQKEWAAKWRGQRITVYTAEQALQAIGAIRRVA